MQRTIPSSLRQAYHRRIVHPCVWMLTIIFLISTSTCGMLYAGDAAVGPGANPLDSFAPRAISPEVNEQESGAQSSGASSSNTGVVGWDWDANPLSLATTAAAEAPKAPPAPSVATAVAAMEPQVLKAAPVNNVVAVTVTISQLYVQNESTFVVGYKVNTGAYKTASYALSAGLNAMFLNDKDAAGNAFTVDLRDIALGFFADELNAKNGSTAYQAKIFDLNVQGLNYLPTSGKGDLTQKTLDAVSDRAADAVYLTRTSVLNAITAASRHYAYGVNGNVSDFTVRAHARRVPMLFFMHSTLVDADNQAIVTAMFDFYKDPYFFNSAMTSISGGWKVLSPTSALLGYNLAVAATLQSKRLTMASTSVIRSTIIRTWSGLLTSANFSQKFRTAFPALQQEPWDEFDFDFFKSIALFATSTSDVQIVVNTFKLTAGFNADQEYMYRNWGLLVIHGARTFGDNEITQIRTEMARYPVAIRNQVRIVTSSPYYFSDGGPSYGRGGYSLPFNMNKEGMMLLGKNQWDYDISWTINHEMGHFMMDLLDLAGSTDNLLISKRPLHEQIFDLGTTLDRPDEEGFQGCKPSPSCTNTSWSYANSDHYENMAEFAASMMNDSAWFFNKWVNAAVVDGRFIGLRTLMFVMEVLAVNNGNQVPFNPSHQLGGTSGGGAPVNIATVLDVNKNITRLSIPLLPNPPFDVPASMLNKIYEFTYTPDNLQIMTITIRDFTTGALISISANPALPHDTTAPVVTLSAAASITPSSAVVNFTTNEASYYQVEYSTSSSFTSSVKKGWSSSKVTSASQPLSGLAENTTYYVRVSVKDAYGNLKVSSTINFKTIDATAPVVSLSAAASITKSSAVIHFTTNEAAFYQIEYSTASNFAGSVKTAWSTAAATSASQTLSGLSQSTTYYVRILAKDAAGNLTTSAAINFKTLTPDTTPPAVTLSAASSITKSSAAISFTTNEAAFYQIEYSTSSNFSGSVKTAMSTAAATSASQILSGLSQNTTYYVRVIAKDAAGNQTVSAAINFKTLLPDTTKPIVGAPAISSITKSGATVKDTANEPSYFVAEYSVDGTFTTSLDTPKTTVLSTSYTAFLTGLKAGTKYHVRVWAIDAAGNVSSSQITSFTTSL